MLIFTGVSDRRELLDKLCTRMKPGAAIIVFDRTIAASGYEAKVMMRMVWNGKLKAGVSMAEVADKEMRLVGVQRPIEPVELGDALEIFRFADFAGWIIQAQPRRGSQHRGGFGGSSHLCCRELR
ncbi:hypothetical protein [Ensifer canadensis]